VANQVEVLPSEGVGDRFDDLAQRGDGGLLNAELTAAASEARQVQGDAPVPRAQRRQHRLSEPAPEGAMEEQERRGVGVARAQVGQGVAVHVEVVTLEAGVLVTR